MKDSRGIAYSSLLHGIILILLVLGLPDFFHRQIDTEPEAVSVEILPIAPVSNVKPQEKQPEPEKRPPEEKNTEQKAKPEASQPQEKPEEQQAVPLPDKTQVVEKKKPEKKRVEKKKTNDFDSILKSVQQQAKEEESKKPSQEAPSDKRAKSTNYDASQPLSMSEKDAIRSQIEPCWNAPVGAKDAQNLVVTLQIALNQDGAVTKVELARDQARYASDPFFRAAADAAIRAVNRCNPLKNLPPDKYGTWSDMELDFNPHDMLY